MVATRADLRDWVSDAIKAEGGKASILAVAKHIWGAHETDLKAAGDLFYTWQYDMRWAATSLRRKGKIVAAGDDRRGTWTLTGK